MDALVPRDAADTVHALSVPGGIHRRAAPLCPPLALATATPLEAACASPQQGASAIDALVLEGARLDGAEGARVLLACLACGHRRKARLLLQRQVRLCFSRLPLGSRLRSPHLCIVLPCRV